jgi:hypothetical protein
VSTMYLIVKVRRVLLERSKRLMNMQLVLLDSIPESGGIFQILREVTYKP